MALTLTIETGAIVAGANSYISLADAETFFESQAYTETWDAATSTDELKNQALAHATKILDQQFTWKGKRTQPSSQPLQWPRWGVTEPDRNVPNNEIPSIIKEAQCLIAQSLLANSAFFTRDPGAGGADQLAGISLGQGALQIDYQGQSEEGASSTRYKTIIGGEVLSLLSIFGTFKLGSGVRRVRRG